MNTTTTTTATACAVDCHGQDSSCPACRAAGWGFPIYDLAVGLIEGLDRAFVAWSEAEAESEETDAGAAAAAAAWYDVEAAYAPDIEAGPAVCRFCSNSHGCAMCRPELASKAAKAEPSKAAKVEAELKLVRRRHAEGGYCGHCRSAVCATLTGAAGDCQVDLGWSKEAVELDRRLRNASKGWGRS